MSGKLIPFRRVDGRSEEMSDEALLAACSTGESAALGALFDRYNQRVYRFVASRARRTDAADLDDLVQQTFMAVARGAEKFSGRSSVSTWIFGIANNIVRHHTRAESRRHRLAQAAASEQLSSPQVVGDGVVRAEQKRALRAAIEGLSDSLREAFVLVYMEGLAGKEAAALIGCREGTLYKRLHQARAALRDQLSEGDRE